MIRLAGWSAPLLFTYGLNRFSHDMAHIYSLGVQKKKKSCFRFPNRPIKFNVTASFFSLWANKVIRRLTHEVRGPKKKKEFTPDRLRSPTNCWKHQKSTFQYVLCCSFKHIVKNNISFRWRWSFCITFIIWMIAVVNIVDIIVIIIQKRKSNGISVGDIEKKV